MALVEEDLPGVSKVRNEFQVREDQVLAHQLQEAEFEEHFNSNVQLRRTARHDVNIAKAIQDKETESYHKEELIRRQQLREREDEDRRHAEEMARKLEENQKRLEEEDRRHAQEMAKKLEEEEKKLKEREQKDQEHAAKMAQRLKEEEEIQKALRLQDEITAKKMHEAEARKLAQRRQQEETDANMARQVSQKNTRQRRPQEQGLSERDVQRMKQVQIQDGGSNRADPRRSLPLNQVQQQQGANAIQVSSSLPPNMRQQQLPNGSQRARVGKNTTPTSSLASGEGFALPSYDQCVPNGSSPVLADGDGEVVIDENERIALQEAEDERLAREMLQKEEDERRRREEADMEFARRMHEEEAMKTKNQAKPNIHSEDLELARRLHEEETRRSGRAPKSSHEQDMALARQLHQQELEASRKKMQQQGAPSQKPQDPDAEFAMRLHREEVMRAKELKRQKMAQQKVLEEERLKKQQQQQQQNGSSSRQQPPVHQTSASRFAGYEIPPFPEDNAPAPAQVQRNIVPNMQQKKDLGSQNPREAPARGQQVTMPPSGNQALPPDGHPFNPASTSFYSYQPAMAGVQIPRAPKNASPSQPQPSYKRSADTGKKKKK